MKCGKLKLRCGGLEVKNLPTVQETLRGVTPHPRSGTTAGRSYPMPEARGGGQERQPHVQGAVAAWVQEGLEELFHVQGQEGPP